MQILALTYASATPITPSDTTAINCRGIYIGGAGSVTIRTVPGANAVTFTAPPAGSILPIMIDGGQIMAATTATLLLALA